MATLNEIKDALYNWLDNISTREIQFANEGLEQPNVPFIEVWVRESSAQPYPRQTLTATNETTLEVVELPVTFNLRGGDAFDDASALRRSLWSSNRYRQDELWQVAGLGAISSIIDLTELESGTLAARAEFRVTLHAEMTTAVTGDSFTEYITTLSVPEKPHTETVTLGPNPRT